MHTEEGIQFYDLYADPFNIKSSDKYITMMSTDNEVSLRVWGTNDKTNFTNLTKAYALKYDISGSDQDTTAGFESIGVIPYSDDNQIDQKYYTHIFKNKYRYILLQAISPDIHLDTEQYWSAQYPKIPYYTKGSLGTGDRVMPDDIKQFYDIDGSDHKTTADIALEDDNEVVIEKYDTTRNGIPELRSYTVVNDANERLTNLTIGCFTYYKGKPENISVPNPNFSYSDYKTFRGPTVSAGSGLFQNFDILKYKTARIENKLPFPLKVRIVGYTLPTKGRDPFAVQLK